MQQKTAHCSLFDVIRIFCCDFSNSRSWAIINFDQKTGLKQLSCGEKKRSKNDPLLSTLSLLFLKSSRKSMLKLYQKAGLY